MATLIASEWENQETLLKPHTLPMVSSVRLLEMMADTHFVIDVPYVESHRRILRRRTDARRSACTATQVF